MRTGGLLQFMRFVCNLPQIMRLFDFGRNYAKNCASIIRQGLHLTLNDIEYGGILFRHCQFRKVTQMISAQMDSIQTQNSVLVQVHVAFHADASLISIFRII